MGNLPAYATNITYVCKMKPEFVKVDLHYYDMTPDPYLQV